MIAQKVPSVVMSDVGVPSRTIDSIHADIRHNMMSVAGYEVSGCASKVEVPGNLRNRLPSSDIHLPELHICMGC